MLDNFNIGSRAHVKDFESIETTCLFHGSKAVVPNWGPPIEPLRPLVSGGLEALFRF